MKNTLALVVDFVPDGNRSFEAFLLGFSEKMVSAGWRLVHVYSGEPGPRFLSRLSEMNVPYILAPKSLTFSDAYKLGSELKVYSPDVMLTAFYNAFNPVMWQLFRSSSVKHWVVSDHSSGVVNFKRGLANILAKLRGAIVSRFVDRVIACSDFVRIRDIQSVYFRESKVKTVHNGIDVNRFAPREQRENNPVKIVYAGQLIPEKGVATLLRAVADLRTEVKPRLLIAGTGYQQVELELLAYDLGLEPEWLGRIDWIPQLFASSDIAVFPSNWAEAFGLVVAEAMACESCVVASDIGGIPEVVGEGGVIVPPGDVKALQVILDRLIENPILRRRLGEAGRRRVLEKFTIDKMIDGYAMVVNEVIR